MVFCSVSYTLSKREKEVNKRIIKFLIENGADKHKKSKKGKNCFDLVIKHNNKEEVTQILENTK